MPRRAGCPPVRVLGLVDMCPRLRVARCGARCQNGFRVVFSPLLPVGTLVVMMDEEERRYRALYDKTDQSEGRAG
jgi:hypothetical protein